MSGAEKVVLYPPQMEAMGRALAASLGAPAMICTSDANGAGGDSATVLCWDSFPSASSEKDPNVKAKFEALVGKHVVLLLSQDDTSTAFAQLSLLLWLQRFYVPRPIEAMGKRKWKDTVSSGEFDVASVAALTVVIPWYRYCQMERTSRWAYLTGADKPWTNAVADGAFIDMPTAQTYAALLSADPPPPPGSGHVAAPPAPPKQLLLIDIHDDLNGPPVVESTLSKTGKWVNPTVQYNLVTGDGTYFASAFGYFLENVYLPKLSADIALSFVIFPDAGAYARFHTMVST